uniref:53-BP1_Tudor domain-containing protein n=1 Tax=Mesocestoides corti TaxID=53468 RepID=A0A5K3F667_MESCO
MLYLSKPVVNTQQDDFEDIRQSLSSYQSSVNRTRENSCGNMSQFSQIANPISGDQRIASSSPIQPPHLSTNRPDPTILVADPFVSSSSYQQIRHTSGGDFNSPRASQLDNVRLTSLEVRTSAPVTISSKREQCSSAYMASGESTRQDSCSSACSPSSISTGHVNAKTTNTTSTRTTRSGSDIFQSDSSEFHKPLLPPNKRITTVSTSTTTTAITDDQDTSPLFSYVLSLSVLRHVPKVERAEYVEFNSPDFVKTVAWRNRVQRMDENAESAVSDAAKILADAFADWLRESLVSESEGVHSDYNQPPATVVPRRQITNDARLSSSSSDCFDSRKSNILTKKPESRAHECQDPFESDSTRSPGQTFGSNTTVPDLDSQTNKKTTSPTPVTFETNNEKPSDSCSYEKLDVHPGALVYAKWRTDEYYYSGYIVKALGVDRYRIRFDDKSSGIIPAKDILQHALLPIGSNVVVDNSGRGEYEVGYVIVGHENRAVADPMKAMPSYVVKCIEDGREFTLERLRAAIHLDEVKRLSALGSVVTIGETSGCASMTSDHSQTPSSASSPCLRSRGVSSKVASADVSLDNIVYGKRSLTEKRGVLERAAPLSAPIRRGIRRKMPSQAGDTSTSVPSSPESCKMRQKAMLLRKGTSAKTSSRRHVRLSQRESQVSHF